MKVPPVTGWEPGWDRRAVKWETESTRRSEDDRVQDGILGSLDKEGMERT